MDSTHIAWSFFLHGKSVRSTPTNKQKGNYSNRSTYYWYTRGLWHLLLWHIMKCNNNTGTPVDHSMYQNACHVSPVPLPAMPGWFRISEATGPSYEGRLGLATVIEYAVSRCHPRAFFVLGAHTLITSRNPMTLLVASDLPVARVRAGGPGC